MRQQILNGTYSLWIFCEKCIVPFFFRFCLLFVTFYAFSHFAKTNICIIFLTIFATFPFIVTHFFFSWLLFCFYFDHPCVRSFAACPFHVFGNKISFRCIFVAALSNCWTFFCFYYIFAHDLGFVVRKLHVCFLSLRLNIIFLLFYLLPARFVIQVMPFE